MPLWDLAGKALRQPVYALLGGKGARRVPVYDGSIYFADLLPEYTSRDPRKAGVVRLDPGGSESRHDQSSKE